MYARRSATCFALSSLLKEGMPTAERVPRGTMFSISNRGNGLRVAAPAFANFGEELGFVFLDEADQGLIAGILVSSRPQHHFGEDGSKVHSFCGQMIKDFSAVRGIRLS